MWISKEEQEESGYTVYTHLILHQAFQPIMHSSLHSTQKTTTPKISSWRQEIHSFFYHSKRYSTTIMTTTMQRNSENSKQWGGNLHDLCMHFLGNCRNHKMHIFVLHILDEVYVYAELKSWIYYPWLAKSKSDSYD